MGKKKDRSWPPVPAVLEAPVVDNHTHLPVAEWEIPQVKGFRPDLETQLSWAAQAGVVGMITSACQTPEWPVALEQAHKYPQVKVALAIHPNEIPLHEKVADTGPDNLEPKYEPHHDEPWQDALDRLQELIKDEAVVAVGETGLDYFRSGPVGREAQKRGFAAHIALAKAAGLPMQIHDRDAHDDVVQILRSEGAPEKTVFHCFSGGPELARIAAEEGWFASFAGPVTYPANEYLREALRILPKELVLVETDAPYLTPVPFRGCPNGSYLVVETVRAIAQIWGVEAAEAANILRENTARVYGCWW